jgi:hypothetical protein
MARRPDDMPEGDEGRVKVEETPEFKDALAAAVKEAVEKETDGLRSNRDAILEEKRKLKESLGKFDEVDPDRYAELVAAETKRQREDAEAKGEFGKLEAQLKEQHATELTKLSDRAGVLTRALEDELVKRAAIEELAKHSDTPGLLLPHVLKHVKMVEDNAKFSVVVVDDAGTPRIAPDAQGTGDLMTISQLVGSMKEQDEFKPGFRGSGGAGSSASGSGNSGAGGIQEFDPGDTKGIADNLEAIAEGKARIRME